MKKQSKPSPTMGICGVLLAATGVWLLIFNPSESPSAAVINLHNVIIGQTLTICGTILCAVQWRN